MSEKVPALRVKDLDVSFRVEGEWVPAVKSLSFDIAERETIAIVGESGSGKSVTAMSIMRVLPPNARISGTIEAGGKGLLTLPEVEMRSLRGSLCSMIFQEPMTSLNPVLTIGFQIAEVVRRHKGCTQREALRAAVELLDLVRIPNAAERLEEYPHRLSGGMRQRAMIAIALACRPSILIADEPTTALDVTIQAEILALIADLQREIGMALLFVTHDMGVVAEIADRVVIMRRGDNVEAGPVAEIFNAPKHSYTKALISAVPRLGDMKGHSKPRKFVLPDEVSATVSPSAKTAVEQFPIGDRPLLEVCNLTTRFNMRSGFLRRVTSRVHAVENVSFEVRAGETLSIVGESGCGKSTTGKNLVRLVEPSSGSVLFDGRDILTLGKGELRRARRDIQMIFQDPFGSLNPRQSIGRCLAEPLEVHGIASGRVAEEKIVQLLRRVGLRPEHRFRYPHEFSGGQRQRICIARALTVDPRLIIADEAVSALDVTIKAQVLNLMMDLQAEAGLAYIFISHDMAVVERVSHRVAVMYLGEIVEWGSRAAVFDNPQHSYTKRLLAAVPSGIPGSATKRRNRAAFELPSVLRKPDFIAPKRDYREFEAGHFAMAEH